MNLPDAFDGRKIHQGLHGLEFGVLVVMSLFDSSPPSVRSDRMRTGLLLTSNPCALICIKSTVPTRSTGHPQLFFHCQSQVPTIEKRELYRTLISGQHSGGLSVLFLGTACREAHTRIRKKKG